MPTGLSTACAVQWGVFVLFACCVFLMTLSVYLFFPETKGVPIEDCPYVFKHHWYWKKCALLSRPWHPVVSVYLCAHAASLSGLG